MNVIYVFIAIGVVISSAVADVAPPANRTKFENFIFQRCSLYNADLVAYDNIKNHFDQFTDYFKLTFSHLPHEKSTFCDNEKRTLVDLMRSLLKEMKPCLPKEEKYLPDFIYESFADFLIFLCEKNGKNIDNFFSTAGKECLNKLKQESGGSEVSHCFKKIVAPLDPIVKKEKLCEDMETAKRCFSTAITKHCPEIPAFETLNNRFFKAIHSPCSAHWISGISSFLLLASILVHKMTS